MITPDRHIATLTDKKAELEIELELEKGVGYVSVEQRRKEKLAIGVIAIDAIFSPVKLVNFTVENVRVGQRIDYNKVVMEVETDGSIEPEAALKKATEILIENFKIISEVEVPEKSETKKAKKEPKSAKAKKK